VLSDQNATEPVLIYSPPARNFAFPGRCARIIRI
jgi:hypothetical protein